MRLLRAIGWFIGSLLLGTAVMSVLFLIVYGPATYRWPVPSAAPFLIGATWLAVRSWRRDGQSESTVPR